jgi:hypothetical protein
MTTRKPHLSTVMTAGQTDVLLPEGSTARTSGPHDGAPDRDELGRRMIRDLESFLTNALARPGVSLGAGVRPC